jgi:hypothetical protein
LFNLALKNKAAKNVIKKLIGSAPLTTKSAIGSYSDPLMSTSDP